MFSSSEFVNVFKARKDTVPYELRPSTVVYHCNSTILSDVGPSSLCYRIMNHAGIEKAMPEGVQHSTICPGKNFLSVKNQHLRM